MIQLCLLKFHLYTDNVKDMKKYFCLVLYMCFFERKIQLLTWKLRGWSGGWLPKEYTYPYFTDKCSLKKGSWYFADRMYKYIRDVHITLILLEFALTICLKIVNVFILHLCQRKIAWYFHYLNTKIQIYSIHCSWFEKLSIQYLLRISQISSDVLI